MANFLSKCKIYLSVFRRPLIMKYSWQFLLPKLVRTFALTALTVLSFTLISCQMSQTPAATPTLGVIMTAMVARLDGKLEKIDGCIRVRSGELDNGYALVWPPDHKMTIEDGQVRVVSGIVSGKRREVVLKFGEDVTLSGGIVVNLDEQLEQTIPANCPAPYWAVGNTIQPIATQPP